MREEKAFTNTSKPGKNPERFKRKAGKGLWLPDVHCKEGSGGHANLKRQQANTKNVLRAKKDEIHTAFQKKIKASGGRCHSGLKSFPPGRPHRKKKSPCTRPTSTFLSTKRRHRGDRTIHGMLGDKNERAG